MRLLEPMKKLLVFDSWTKGSSHILPLISPFRKKGWQLVLVHLGSWGDDLGRPVEENFSGLDVRDISRYSGFSSILVEERPTAVLLLSTEPLAHRAFQRYCLKKNIPTVHLYHGLMSVQSYADLTVSGAGIINHLRWVTGRVIRSLHFVLPAYIESLFRTQASLKEWWSFLIEILQRIRGIRPVKSPADTIPSHVIVFNDFDKVHALEKYGVSSNRISAAGVPDLIKFQKIQRFIGQFIKEDTLKKKYIVYIGTGPRGVKSAFSDISEYVHHLLRTKTLVEKIGKIFILKPHYSMHQKIVEYLSESGYALILCEDQDFVDYLVNSAGAIVEPSSAAILPALIGKPLFFAQYQSLQGLKFGDVLISYPKAATLRSDNDFHLLGEAYCEADVGKTLAWIENTAGPMPAEQMPDRVAAIVEEIVSKKMETIAYTNRRYKNATTNCEKV